MGTSGDVLVPGVQYYLDISIISLCQDRIFANRFE
jgi:hypothetical protein